MSKVSLDIGSAHAFAPNLTRLSLAEDTTIGQPYRLQLAQLLSEGAFDSDPSRKAYIQISLAQLPDGPVWGRIAGWSSFLVCRSCQLTSASGEGGWIRKDAKKSKDPEVEKNAIRQRFLSDSQVFVCYASSEPIVYLRKSWES